MRKNKIGGFWLWRLMLTMSVSCSRLGQNRAIEAITTDIKAKMVFRNRR